MDRLGEAVELACVAADPAFRRINLEILGNTDAFLHAHIWPRYDWESAERAGHPVWLYPDRNWADPATALGPQHDPLRAAIQAGLRRLPGQLDGIRGGESSGLCGGWAG